MSVTKTKPEPPLRTDASMLVRLGAKQTGLGVIPDERGVKLLGDIADLKNGYAFRSNTYAVSGKYRIITIANVQDGYLSLESFSTIDKVPRDRQEAGHQAGRHATTPHRQDRLPGFSGEWETKRLGDFASIRNQKVLPSNVDSDPPLCGT